jgi:TonB family protein
MYGAQKLIIFVEMPTVSSPALSLCCVLLLIVAGWAAFPNSAWAQTPDLVLTKEAEAQLESLASRVSARIKASERGPVPAYVIVFDFLRQSPEASSLLGTLLADRFADALSHQGNGIVVMNRELLKNYLKSNLMNTEDIGPNSAYLSIANELGATDLIRAYLSENGIQVLNVTVHREGIYPPFDEEAKFPLWKDLEDLLGTPAPSNHRDPRTIPAEQGVIVMGGGKVEGVQPPMCITCPDPKYTEPARAAKFSNGTVIMSALVTTDGQVKSVYVMRGLPFGLAERAATAVKDWKLKPAMKDGQPVAVRVDVETTFRLL